MAGIYIHIPFCKQACHYCDFHFSVSIERKEELLSCIRKEIIQRTDFLHENEPINTIYFGGGTPSLMSIEELQSIIQCIKENYNFNIQGEICLEANPDDLNLDYLRALKMSGVNRLSIGVQSLLDRDLEWMNRSHTAKEAIQVVKDASKLGFEDLSIDLIYGIPGLSTEEWNAQVTEILQWPINHLSAYSLTMEAKTVYAKKVKDGISVAPPDELAIAHYEALQQQVSVQGWEQYEISNYCKQSNYSKHNTAYWTGERYLGIGPSAHSYNGVERSWNVRSNAAYIQQSKGKGLELMKEVLSREDLINERLLTGLRTKWGVDMALIEKELGIKLDELKRHEIHDFVFQGVLSNEERVLRLTDNGKLLADHISASLFVDHSSQISS
ncbi:MAG: radical SAM family heme chaperone HemW [Bacteroidia bacterium]